MGKRKKERERLIERDSNGREKDREKDGRGREKTTEWEIYNSHARLY